MVEEAFAEGEQHPTILGSKSFRNRLYDTMATDVCIGDVSATFRQRFSDIPVTCQPLVGDYIATCWRLSGGRESVPEFPKPII